MTTTETKPKDGYPQRPRETRGRKPTMPARALYGLIVKRAREVGFASTEECAQAFGVTRQAVRFKLDEWADAGAVLVLRGGHITPLVSPYTASRFRLVSGLDELVDLSGVQARVWAARRRGEFVGRSEDDMRAAIYTAVSQFGYASAAFITDCCGVADTTVQRRLQGALQSGEFERLHGGWWVVRKVGESVCTLRVVDVVDAT